MNRAHRLAAAVLLLSAPARGQTISAMPGTLPLSIAQGNVTANQSLPAAVAGSAIILGNTGAGTLSVTLAGLSASGAIVAFSASDNGGVSYYPVGGLSGAANTRTTTAAADGSYTFSVAGRTAIQIAVSVAGVGTVAASYTTSAGVRVVTVDSSARSPVFTQDNAAAVAIAHRVTLMQVQVPVPAAASTLLLAANANRRSLRISGTNAGDSFRLGYGAAATASSSALFGSGGVFAAEQYGPGDGVPTGAIYAYSATAFTAQVGEGN